MNDGYFLRRLFFTFGFITLTLVLIDMLAFVITPERGFSALATYKNQALLVDIQNLIRQYPRNYHLSDPRMGFDIAPNQPLMDFEIPDKALTIFSNSLGCMDHLTLSDIQHAPSYEYITGDSFTWGYADYASKYPKVYEALTGKMVVKCGITHSGQAHQFDKFSQVVKAIGHYPKRVLIAYFENDVINDYVYPHTTVIEGFQIDRYEVDGRYRLYERDLHQIRSVIFTSIQEPGIYPTARKVHRTNDQVVEYAKKWLLKYSLSTNLIKYGFDQISQAVPMTIKGKELISSIPSKSLLSGDSTRYSIYKLSEQVRFDDEYRTMKITQSNRRAIMHWAEDARKHAYELTIMIIPNKGSFNQEKLYAGFELFLREQEIPYLNMAKAFHDSNKPVDYFYWPNDGHWNDLGNEFVGAYLAKQLW